METAAVVLVGALAGVLLLLAGVAAIGFLVYRRYANLEHAVDRLTLAVANPDQAWYWTPQWQAMEREADVALAQGRLVGPMTDDEFMAYLDRLDGEADREQRAAGRVAA